ncbi:MAG: TonB-dependent receptor [Proteobacteria bacterium]|nr:TonB-dependent receptor [Pseudomonadota bacterium]
MQFIPHRRRLLCAAISMSLIPLSGISLAQQDSQVEEVIVTGSYIRRTEGFRAASPITQISADEIAAAGTPNMGDVIHNLSFNQGTTVTANAFTGAQNIATSLNLRGLGAGATLDLLDGIRNVSSNVNILLPQIAIQRLDIVTDGAAALYGSQAVAGVVNFVPIKSYDGFKLEHMSQGDDQGDYNDVQFQALYGTEFNGIDIVVAGGWREHSRLEMRDRPDTLRSAFVWSSTATPGDYRVPLRDANGALTGSSAVQADPGCGAAHEDPTKIKNGEFGFLRSPTNCAYDYGEFWDYRYPTQQGTLFTSASYDFSNDLSVNAQYSLWDVKHQVRGSPINPGGRVTELPIVRGEIPGNPFPALDANGNQLFALDANGDGVPDRVGGDPFGTVILDPNGIPFNEDVSFASWRPWAKHGTLPSIFNSDGSSPRDGHFFGSRAVLQADFNVPYLEGWEGHAAYMWSQEVDNDKDYEGSFGGLNQGLRCDVATDREACFTPFVTDAANANTQAVADSTVNYARERNEERLQTFDLVINGSVPLGSIELPGGPVGAALGYQRRDEQFDDSPASYVQQNDQWIGSQELPNSGGRQVDSFFAELSLPVLNNLELQLAVRDEDYSTGQNSTDPKYGIVYSPFNNLTLRASKGTSFIAPSLNALTSPQVCGLQNIADPFTIFAAFTSSCNQGNPNLVPESADTVSAGFDWDIIDGMRLSLTYSETDFTDRIVATNSQDILANDFFNFQQAFGAVPAGQKPTLTQVANWVNDPRSDKRVVRDPNNLAEIVRVFQSSSNASNMLVQAYDLDFNYQFELPDMFNLNDIGSFSLNLVATYLDEYSFQLSAKDPVNDAVGHRNNGTGAVPPMPRVKGNFRIGWVNGDHSANLTSHYLHSLRYDGFQGNFLAGLHSSVVPKTVTELRASHVEDFAYNYRGLEAFGSELTLTAGSRNLFDRRPQRISELGGTEERLYDAMGRMIYARVSLEL